MKKFIVYTGLGLVAGATGTLYLQARTIYRSDILRPMASDFINDVIHVAAEKALFGTSNVNNQQSK